MCKTLEKYNINRKLASKTSSQLSYSSYRRQLLCLELLGEQYTQLMIPGVTQFFHQTRGGGGRTMAAEPCQRRAAGLTQIDPSRTMRHLIRLKSTALLDSLQRNEIRSSRVIDVVGQGPRRIPILFSGLGNRSLTVYFVVLARYSCICRCYVSLLGL